MKTKIFTVSLIVFFFLLLIGNVNSEKLVSASIAIVQNRSIQEMIDSASIGDVIRVPKGIYIENILINKSITLVGNDQETIVDASGTGSVFTINASNVVLTNFTIRNSGNDQFSSGIQVLKAQNVSIISNKIIMNYYGIRIDNGENCNVTGNQLENNVFSIWLNGSNRCFIDWNNLNLNYGQAVSLIESNNIQLIKNKVKNNPAYGVYLENSNESLIFGNEVGFVCSGIFLQKSFKNNLTENFISDTGPYGIFLNYSDSNAIKLNNLTRNEIAFQLWFSKVNVIHNNSIVKNKFGLLLWFSGNNWLDGNRLESNFWSFGVHGFVLCDFLSNITVSNIIDGRPIYYWSNTMGGEIPENVGFIGIINSTKVRIKNINIKNNYQGLLIVFSDLLTIENVSLSNNWHGVYMIGSNMSTFVGNNFVSNLYDFFLINSNNNLFYHNNFIGNNIGYFKDSVNIWNYAYPKGGNYWIYYSGRDDYSGEMQDTKGSDGIGDNPFYINGDFDRYPLINTVNFYSINLTGNLFFKIGIFTKSDLLSFSLNQSNTSLDVYLNVTSSYDSCRIIIPKMMLWCDKYWDVTLNGEPVNYTLTEDNEHTYIYIPRIPSGLQFISIKGSGIISENLFAYIACFAILSSLIIVMSKFLMD